MQETIAEKPRLLSIKAAAIYLGLREPFVYELTARGDIPYVRIGGRKMVKVSDIETLIEENTVVAGGQR